MQERNNMVDLSQLNSEQREPVLDTEGAVLVTAGAGSGKTRLLTYRIAYILQEKDIYPSNVLALTFTNKAAGEMRDRLEKMGCDSGVWVFTFHALCVRILRKYSTLLGYETNFTIYGDSETKALIKKICKEKELEDDEDVKSIISFISDAKSANISPSEYEKIYSFNPLSKTVAEVYEEYNKSLKRNNAFDYDDLLNFAYKLLKESEEVRNYYCQKFHYIFIDEFQDTNVTQYEIVKILASFHGNIFAVGDEDQSIYGWRGANFKNIFNFRNDFKNVRTYKLEQNYRSTKKIIALANKVIKANSQRLDKNLWTANGEGNPIVYYKAKSDRAEANYVLEIINRLISYENYKLSDFAILMRINALTRTFEEKFVEYGVAHKIFGGFKFFERKEIKDVLAYLKVLDNHADEESLLRIINFPKRGIGSATIGQLVNYARVEDTTLYDVIFNIETNEDLPKSIIKKIMPLTVVFHCLEKAVELKKKPSIITKYLCKLIDLKSVFEGDSDENLEHKMNIKELVRSMEEQETDREEYSLSDYLQTVSLYSDTDEMSDENYVTLATIHSAKGLEFKVVFLVGMEEGVFPSSRCEGESDKIEEERRLLYVGITRAQERLYVTRAVSRFKFGREDYCVASQFVKEMGFNDSAEKVSSGGDPKSRYDQSSGYGGYSYSRSYAKRPDTYNPEQVPDYVETEIKSPTLKTKTTQLAGGKDLSKFVVGAKVRHKKFGVGIIRKLTSSTDVCVTVEFPQLGQVTLMLAYAPLEIVEE